MAKKRNIESASVFERSGIRAIRVRAIEIRLYIQRFPGVFCYILGVKVKDLATLNIA